MTPSVLRETFNIDAEVLKDLHTHRSACITYDLIRTDNIQKIRRVKSS